MSVTNMRQGSGVRIAAKFQDDQGVPVEAADWVSADLLRADEAPAPNPNVEIIAQTGSTGSPYEQDEGVSLVGIVPEIEGTLKVNPPTVDIIFQSLLGVDGVLAAGIKTYTGFELGLEKFLTWLWDDTFEAVRASDVWLHTAEFRSFSSENLIVRVNGTGYDIDKVAPPLTTQALTGDVFYTYSHKASTIQDFGDTGSPVEVMAMEQTLRIEHGRVVTRANRVAPNFVGKDGRISVTGKIRTRLYDDNAAWFDRILNLTRSTLIMRYVQQDGKTLEFEIRNATFTGRYPTLNADGTLGDYEIEFTARQKGDSDYPLIVRVEV